MAQAYIGLQFGKMAVRGDFARRAVGYVGVVVRMDEERWPATCNEKPCDRETADRPVPDAGETSLEGAKGGS